MTFLTHTVLGVLSVLLVLLIWLLPLDVLETLSLDVIGEPPINGQSWTAGVEALGGSFSMRLLATLGAVIMLIGVRCLLARPNTEVPLRRVARGELGVFFGVAVGFGAANLYLGYGWWDAEAFLGMGPYFAHSMALLLGLGLAPHVAGRVFRCDPPTLANRHDDLLRDLLPVLLIAFGYGLVSCVWHCCSFFAPKMIFFFFVIKGVQLWAVCTFFYGWGFKMLLQAWDRRWLAYFVTAVLFGFCYPWHTSGFAVAFSAFGLLLCAVTLKTGSYLTGWALLYFAYIFHAGLPWHGPALTFSVVFPVVVLVLALGVWRTVRHPRCRA